MSHLKAVFGLIALKVHGKQLVTYENSNKSGNSVKALLLTRPISSSRSFLPQVFTAR